MALRSCVRGCSTTHLRLLSTCVLLITGGVRGSEIEEIEIEGGEGGGGEAVIVWDEEVRKEVEGGVVAVESGTSDAVVLDCPYHLNEEDTKGLHLAWYHPRFANPVYQWIPNNKPRAMFILEDRVDLTYEASTDALHRYRALRILQPTTDLNGRYKCRVSSFTVDKSYTQDLIVFKEPSVLDVKVEEREEGQVAVMCKVEEVFPQPVLSLYQKSSSKDSEMMRGSPVTSFVGKTYNMEVEKVLEEATLDRPTEFECHVTIPKTEVQIITSTTYQPRVTASPVIENSSSSTQQGSVVLLVVLSILVCLLRD